MNIEQSLQFIKAYLDQSLKAGVCNNMETANQLLKAYSIIFEKLKDENKQ